MRGGPSQELLRLVAAVCGHGRLRMGERSGGLLRPRPTDQGCCCCCCWQAAGVDFLEVGWVVAGRLLGWVGNSGRWAGAGAAINVQWQRWGGPRPGWAKLLPAARGAGGCGRSAKLGPEAKRLTDDAQDSSAGAVEAGGRGGPPLPCTRLP